MSSFFERRKLLTRISYLFGSKYLVSVKAKTEIQDFPDNPAPIPPSYADLCDAFWGRKRTASDDNASVQIPSIPSITSNH